MKSTYKAVKASLGIPSKKDKSKKKSVQYSDDVHGDDDVNDYDHEEVGRISRARDHNNHNNRDRNRDRNRSAQESEISDATSSVKSRKAKKSLSSLITNHDIESQNVSTPSAITSTSTPSSSSGITPRNTSTSYNPNKFKLIISNISVNDIVNVGTEFDKQDPMVQFIIGNQTQRTERQKDAGTSATFDKTVEFSITEAEYSSEEIRIEVFNENAIGLKTHLGKSSAKLNVEIKDFNTDLELAFGLAYSLNGKKSIPQGSVSFMVTLVHFDPEYRKVTSRKASLASMSFWSGSENALGAAIGATIGSAMGSHLSEGSSPRGTTRKDDEGGALDLPPLHKFRLELRDLAVENLVDTGNEFDKQDPMLQVSVGKAIQRTERQKDAGTCAKFGKSLIFELNEEDYSTSEINFEVFNENAIGLKLHLGKCSTQLQLCVPSFNQDLPFSLDLYYSVSSSRSLQKGRVCGTVRLQHYDTNYKIQAEATSLKDRATRLLQLNANSSHASSAIAASPSSANVFKLHISEIFVSDLFDVGTAFDKQDPMIQFTFGRTVQRTERQKDAGTKAHFESIIDFDIPEEDYGTAEITVEAFNESRVGVKTHLGKCKWKLDEHVPDFNSDFEIHLDLTYHAASSRSIQKGNLVCVARLDHYDPNYRNRFDMENSAVNWSIGTSSPWQRKLIIGCWIATQVIVIVIFILGCVAVAKSTSGSAGSLAASFCGMWTCLLLLVILVLGSYCLQKISMVATGIILGVIVVLCSQMLIVFAIFLEKARLSSESIDSSQSDKAMAAFSFILFVMYALFGGMLFCFRFSFRKV